ncbi:sugar phosphate isomerase/epimerase [Acidiphilium sp. AL]|uniref:Sugar phosphate isomerase/epimerase n=1 Tax=Acidiphilium iwatense TaxID=768198 RepID=A0ABS9DZF6_9PROT|nr:MULTISPECIES: sugar phosphate isomerase/epimerase family protein [Acidiphilium]MCF3948121.1 sugar phosphate isomerase/epimerase [Acidiphilium iwatense]MCU4161508.1 sugar phosphate isomerase/epimerase [Acidiphilium sp. AL]
MTKRTLGVCSWIFGGLGAGAIVKAVAPLGYRGIELHPALLEARDTASILADHGFDIVSITPPDADIAHPDPAIREPAIVTLYRMIDRATELGAPRAAVHGLVGRIRPVTTQAEEDDLLDDAVARLADHAAACGIALVFEVLNRYESHQINTAEQGLATLARLGRPNLKLLLDAYHMNIEEPDPAAALRAAGASLGLYHAADSNRRAPGRGHIDFAAQRAALDAISYAGPVVIEITAPGPDPFTPKKSGDFRAILLDDLAAAIRTLGAR